MERDRKKYIPNITQGAPRSHFRKSKKKKADPRPGVSTAKQQDIVRPGISAAKSDVTACPSTSTVRQGKIARPSTSTVTKQDEIPGPSTSAASTSTARQEKIPSPAFQDAIPGPSTSAAWKEETPGPSTSAAWQEGIPGPSTSTAWQEGIPGPSTSSAWQEGIPGPSTSTAWQEEMPGPSTSAACRQDTFHPSTSSTSTKNPHQEEIAGPSTANQDEMTRSSGSSETQTDIGYPSDHCLTTDTDSTYHTVSSDEGVEPPAREGEAASKPKTPPGETYVVCDICRNTLYRNYMRAHRRNVHGVLKSFHCDKCPLSFALEKNFRKHVREVHDKELRCELCDQIFYKKRDLDEHNLNEHGLKRKKFCGLV